MRGERGLKFGKSSKRQSKITTYEAEGLGAAARAHKEAGVPIISHTVGGTLSPEQADLMISQGASPKCTLIGHICGETYLQ